MERSYDRVKEILMFLFHGHYLYRGKKTSIVHAIRRSVMSGRHRFGMNRHRDSYKIFADALDQHPEWETFLDDMGAGTAPMDYNAMVETVLRTSSCQERSVRTGIELSSIARHLGSSR